MRFSYRVARKKAFFDRNSVPCISRIYKKTPSAAPFGRTYPPRPSIDVPGTGKKGRHLLAQVLLKTFSLQNPAEKWPARTPDGPEGPKTIGGHL
jgi:hypothetical protein